MLELDQPIGPEIINDPLSEQIERLASREDVKNILEIGSSSGEGSTKAFYRGIQGRPDVSLFCLEMVKTRFNLLLNNYQGNNDPRMKCINMSSVFPDEFPKEEEIIEFYNNIPSALNDFPIEMVLGWLRADLEYIKANSVHCGGISFIKQTYQVANFDMVLIDGSEFTGNVEFGKIYGAKIIILDDILAFKNFWPNYHLSRDHRYHSIFLDVHLRNGAAIFERHE